MNLEAKTSDGQAVMLDQPAAPAAQRYGVILADPAWGYAFSRANSRRIENQYPTMATEAICGLRVPAADDAALFLWSTAPLLEDALRVMRAWSFAYKSCLVWDKVKMGCGYWARVQHELLLVGVKGEFPPPIPSLRVRSVLRIARTIHSRKPAEVRDMITRWYPNERKLEMFARDRVANWDAWGNEVECDVLIPLRSGPNGCVGQASLSGHQQTGEGVPLGDRQDKRQSKTR